MVLYGSVMLVYAVDVSRSPICLNLIFSLLSFFFVRTHDLYLQAKAPKGGNLFSDSRCVATSLNGMDLFGYLS